ncbi:hypothetical protein BH24BAC1_BH24BAC1_39600 [soil metagenome]
MSFREYIGLLKIIYKATDDLKSKKKNNAEFKMAKQV